MVHFCLPLKGVMLCTFTDESLQFELQAALDYLTQRPFVFKIWDAIPVNSSLVISIVKVCITYTIVALQLLHFSF
ncbi:hypothetical protein O3G_MSEX002901 [Manduca sexta]|uniref:Uncharacterized protein n=1 Tax=Manduca sexta TaxID=7130 RepID=A0A921YPV6_MANSE|nr:hypothetical protein O3G_MSEX002901 [Manduca sexta]